MLILWFSVGNFASRNQFGHNLRPVEFTQLYKSKFNGFGLLRVECCPKSIDFNRYGFNGSGLVISHTDKLEYERGNLLRLRRNYTDIDQKSYAAINKLLLVYDITP